MKIQYIEKTKIAYFNGYRFTKDDKTGYYLSSSKIEGHRKRLHRYIWEYYNGKIPKGYNIHHKDHNKDNNELDNLELLSASEHKKIHAKELTEEQIQKFKNNLEKKARPKAIEWHKSQKGKEWHKKQYKISLGAMKKEKFICEYCGKEYETYKNGKNKFCSEKCMSAYRRKSGVDNIQRNCIVCNKPFTCNKYSKITKCIDCTPERYKAIRRKIEN
jgi:hypothetical protein